MFGYPILITCRIDFFTILFLHFLTSFGFDREGISLTRDSQNTCPNLSKFSKNTPLHVLFSNSLLGVWLWNCSQTGSFIFDVLLRCISCFNIGILIFSFQHDPVPEYYDRVDPEHRHIYKFIKTLFHAAQLTAECAIITLVSLVCVYV